MRQADISRWDQTAKARAQDCRCRQTTPLHCLCLSPLLLHKRRRLVGRWSHRRPAATATATRSQASQSRSVCPACLAAAAAVIIRTSDALSLCTLVLSPLHNHVHTRTHTLCSLHQQLHKPCGGVTSSQCRAAAIARQRRPSARSADVVAGARTRASARLQRGTKRAQRGRLPGSCEGSVGQASRASLSRARA